MYDWNQNGKKDMMDNYIQYQIYKKSTENQNTSYTPRSGSGISTFGAILSVIAGLFGQALIYMALGIEVEDVPVIVMLILWVVISAIVAGLAEMIGL